jgi:hypothetical protein
MARNPNWGGKRPNTGRPRQYGRKDIKVRTKFHIERSEREPLTPESDLSICIAEVEADENDIRRGVVIGDIWYGAKEAIAVADFVDRYRDWLL